LKEQIKKENYLLPSVKRGSEIKHY